MDKLLQSLKGLKDLEYISKEQIEFYTQLFKIQAQVKEKLKRVYFRFSERQIKEKAEKGLPLLSLPRMQVNRRLWLGLLEKLCGLIMDYRKENKPPLPKLIETVKKRNFNYKEFIKNSISFETDYLTSLSEETGVDKFTLLFIGINTAKPFLESISQSLKDKIEDNHWLRNLCPICGGKPVMAKLCREDGRRFFQCCICNTAWSFPRIKCQSCENEDTSSLRFFFVREDSPYRVDVCDKCKSYIKTVDERKFPQDKVLDLVIEDIATSYLDILAEKEGYNRSNEPPLLSCESKKGG